MRLKIGIGYCEWISATRRHKSCFLLLFLISIGAQIHSVTMTLHYTRKSTTHIRDFIIHSSALWYYEFTFPLCWQTERYRVFYVLPIKKNDCMYICCLAHSQIREIPLFWIWANSEYWQWNFIGENVEMSIKNETTTIRQLNWLFICMHLLACRHTEE